MCPMAPKVLRPKRPKRQERRMNSHQRGYTHKWEKASRAWLNEQFAAGNVRCAWCNGLLMGDRSEIVVDHIIDHKGDQEKFWNESNWQVLHRVPCHSQKTARDNGFGR